MTLPSFQQTVAEFVASNQLEAPVETRLLDLVSEVGELAKEVLKAGDYGRRLFQTTDAWSDELADTFFSLICVANSTNVDLEVVLAQALKKYGERLAQSGEAGSGR